MNRICSFAMSILLTGAVGHVAWADDEGKNVPTTIPVLSLSGSISDYNDPLALFQSQSLTMYQITSGIRKAAADESVAALLVRLEVPSFSLTQALDLNDALVAFKKSGKPVYTSADLADTTMYLATSSSTEFVMPEVGLLDLHGLKLSLYYMKDTLAKVGIAFDSVTMGQYKNALEPLTHNSMTDATREQYTQLMEDWHGTISGRIAEGRDMTVEEGVALFDGGPYTTSQAMEAGAVDRVMSIEKYIDYLEDEAHPGTALDWEYFEEKNAKKQPSLMSILMGTGGGFGSKKSKSKGVVVLYATGQIIDGRLMNDNPFATQQAIASDDFIDLIREVYTEVDVDALVIRVDSPGGSAIASDRIWEELASIAEDTPIIVSMGDVAASGGYYISMMADTIVAQETTITGSIGVVGGKINLGETYNMIGLNKQSLSMGANSGLFDEDRAWTPDERAKMQGILEDIYTIFTTKAAAGREMKLDDLKEVAGGRIWTGSSALENGLIDEIGGLERAIELAREAINDPEAKLHFYPREMTFFEVLDKVLSGQVTAPSLEIESMVLKATGTDQLKGISQAIGFLYSQPTGQVVPMAWAPWIVGIE